MSIISIEELPLNKGVQTAIAKINEIKERPILVSVYGWCGKSHFIKLLETHFRREGLRVWGSDGAPNEQEFYRLRDEPESFGDLRLYHCGWVLSDGIQYHQDPNYLAPEIAKRRIHLNIGIYNPISSIRPRGKYDIIIANTFRNENID